VCPHAFRRECERHTIQNRSGATSKHSYRLRRDHVFGDFTRLRRCERVADLGPGPHTIRVVAYLKTRALDYLHLAKFFPISFLKSTVLITHVIYIICIYYIYIRITRQTRFMCKIVIRFVTIVTGTDPELQLGKKVRRSNCLGITKK